MSKEWEQIVDYWIIQTPDGMIRVSGNMADQVVAAKKARDHSVIVEDIYGTTIIVYPQNIELIYNSTPTIRDRATRHGEQRRIAEEAAIKAYRAEVGYFSEE